MFSNCKHLCRNFASGNQEKSEITVIIPMKTPIKLVVFDMAGTTVADENNVATVLQQTLATAGCMVSIDEVNRVMGYPKPVAIRELLKDKGRNVVSEKEIADLHGIFVTGMLEHYRHSPAVAEKEGVRETFYQLKQHNIKVGIDTGFSRDIADTIFDRLGWRKEALFDISITSDEVVNGRPFPDMIFKAMQMAEITDPAEVAKVGDTASDLQEGTAAGCKYVIGITSGAYSRQELMQEQHTHLVHNIREVLSIVC